MCNWKIELADVLDWAANYDGPKFHALLCDPPYHLHSGMTKPRPDLTDYDGGKGNPYARIQSRLPKGGFMGKHWDGGNIAYRPETWAALAEHLLPGAFGMAFASSRGWHRLAVAIEDGGLRIHPSIFGWCYGSGFPKATRIDTQIDKAAGAERRIIGKRVYADGTIAHRDKRVGHEGWGRPWMDGPEEDKGALWDTEPATDLARAWEGHRYGLQAMKPALEPIIVFQKPYEGKPVDSITETGAGALNIDRARIGTGDNLGRPQGAMPQPMSWGNKSSGGDTFTTEGHPQDRWPANFVLGHHPRCRRVGMERVKPLEGHRPNPVQVQSDGQIQFNKKPTGYQKTSYTDTDGLETVDAWDCHPDCPVRKLGGQSGESKSSGGSGSASFGGGLGKNIYGKYSGEKSGVNLGGLGDKGTAARFFFQADWSYEVAERLAGADAVRYCAKASRKERDAGLEEMPMRCGSGMSGTADQSLKTGSGNIRKNMMRNSHPTVKPITLCRWLATLLLPPPEYAPRRILIPFSGTSSEGIGAGLAGWEEVTMIEIVEEYVAVGEPRMQYWMSRPEQLELL